jgi:uncharacterized protein (TIGR02996 family)
MAEHPGFLQAVIEAPDDDAPRLIYADWLEDHGDPERAEFIRLQCRPDPRRVRRAGTLLGVHHARWLAPLLELGLTERPPAYVPWRAGGIFTLHGCEFTSTRGFVSEIAAFGHEEARRLVDAIDLLGARAPLESLVFNGIFASSADKAPTVQRLIDRLAGMRLRRLALNSSRLSLPDQERLREVFGDCVSFGNAPYDDAEEGEDIPF